MSRSKLNRLAPARHLCVVAVVCFSMSVQCHTGVAAESAAQKQADFFRELRLHFTQWDINHDGELSGSEIDALINDPKITGKTAAVVVVLKRIRQKEEKFHVAALTGEAFQKFSETPPGSGDGPNFGQMYFQALSHIGHVDRDLFGGTLPSLASMHQGKLGDCFFLAPLGAAVHRDAKAIREMIEIEPDGSYDVKFATGREVRVPRLTDAEIALTSSTGNGGLWLNVLENAYAMVRNELRPDEQQVDQAIDTIAHGGTTGPVLQLLSGHATKRFPTQPKAPAGGKVSDEQLQQHLAVLRDVIQSAVAEHRLICCGTPGVGITTPAITPAHAYAILNYDKAGDLVEVWNPHGNHFKPSGNPGLQNGYLTQEGRFSLPLAEFVKIFGNVKCEVGQ